LFIKNNLLYGISGGVRNAVSAKNVRAKAGCEAFAAALTFGKARDILDIDNNRKGKMALLTAEGLCKDFGNTRFINGVSLRMPPGRALAVAGENGAGKTTLLKMLATAARPDAGELIIGGVDALKNPAAARGFVGYVPQGIALMQELTVRDNLRYWMKTGDEGAYRWTLDVIGLAGLERKKVSRLSGGMQRRLNIGASLVTRPRLLILDEPLAGVDAQMRAGIMAALQQLKSSGVAIVMTSHHTDELQRLADDLLALKGGVVTYYGGINFLPGDGGLAGAIRRYTA
jgi:ABC-2 type transport system ATP-binding protein